MTDHNHSLSNIHEFSLKNGLKVVAIHSPQAPVVSLQGWVRYGAADETDDIAGVAHLFEHLLFKGTKNRPVGQMAREVENMGGDLNAYTSYDQTVMHMTLPSRWLSNGLDLLSDALIHSVVDAEELERERPVILEEIKRRNDMPGSKAIDLLREGLYGKHPYARPVIGYSDVVSNISRDRIMQEYKKHYNSKNMFLVIAGDFELNSLKNDCEKFFSALPSGGLPPARPTLLPLQKTFSRFENHPTFPDALFHLAWLAPHGADQGVASWDALALILGQGESSRLVRKIVFDAKLLREIGASCWSPKDTGSFAISMRGSSGTSKQFDKILHSIKEVLSKPIEANELEKAKKNLLSSATYSKETVDGLAQRYGYYEAITGSWKDDQKYLDQVSALQTWHLDEIREGLLKSEHFVAGGIFPKQDKLPSIEAWSKKPASVAKQKQQTKNQETHNVHVFNYNNLKVLVRNIEHLPIFSLRWVGLGGNRLEKQNETGLGSLWSRTVTAGARSLDERLWTRDAINHFIDSSSASLASFHGRNSFGFSLDGLSEDFDKLFDLLIAAKLAPTFDSKIFSHEKALFLEDLISAQDSPTNVMSQVFNQSLFGTHPYGRSSWFNKNNIKKMNPKMLIAYHKRQEQQPQVLSVVGDIRPEQVLSFLQTRFPKTVFPKHMKKIKPLSCKYPKRSVEIKKTLKKEQTHIMIGFPTCDLFKNDRWALMALSSMLSGQGGRLFTELRDKMSLCYTVSPTHMEGLDCGYFGFYIATSPDKARVATEALHKELEKIIHEGFTEEELEKAKNFYIGNHIIEQQRISGQAMSMSLNELYGIGYSEFFEFEKNFRAVKKTDILRCLNHYFGKTQRKTFISVSVGP